MNIKSICGGLCSAVLMSAVLAGTVGAENFFYEEYAEPIVSVEDPKGGGNHSIHVMKDGYTPAVGGENSSVQYDTYNGTVPGAEAYVGYTFDEVLSVNTLIFTEGMNFTDGGWFADGSIHVEVLKDGEWQTVESYSVPEYPVSDTHADFGENFETYVFVFEPQEAEGVRISGKAGGSAGFISCSELKVLCDIDISSYTTLDEYIKASRSGVENGWIESISTPITTYSAVDISGGSKDKNSINDGYIPSVGDSYQQQFDTVCTEGKASPGHEEYIGYIFPKDYVVEYIEFTEGGNFIDGGWFADGTMRLEIYTDYQWIEVPFTCSPDYPDSNNQADFLPDYETYTITLDVPSEAKGVRLCGRAGGSAYFISCGELRVKTTVKEK